MTAYGFIFLNNEMFGIVVYYEALCLRVYYLHLTSIGR